MDYFKEEGYPLVIDYPNCSNEELYDIIKILYYGPTACYEDLICSGYDIVARLEEVNYDIANKQNVFLDKLIRTIFEYFKKIITLNINYNIINDTKQILELIYTRYNKYIRGHPSPQISPVTSPVKVPKVIKKNKN